MATPFQKAFLSGQSCGVRKSQNRTVEDRLL
jgi:hypothetical protein